MIHLTALTGMRSVSRRIRFRFSKSGSPSSATERGSITAACDNPGWWVKIDVAGTFMEGKPFAPILENVSDDRMSHGDRWFCCELKENVWHGSGDPKTLNRILLAFLEWLVDVAPGWPERR